MSAGTAAPGAGFLATGASISASTPATARLLEQAIESYLATRADTPTILKQALKGDADQLFPILHDAVQAGVTET